jgi:FAD dependent oxidoreductase TIGR03364
MRPRAVVVGAGVLGCFHALAALRRGYDVVHLEREHAARGASIRNFGLVWISGREAGAELALALRSRALWEELGSQIPEIGFRPNGSLTLVQHEAEVRVLEQVVARTDAPGRELRLLDADEVRELNTAVRGQVLAGMHCALDAAVEPERVPNAIRAVMEQTSGYRWVPARHVVELQDGWVRDHRGERHAGDLVVVCPGAALGFAGWEPGEAGVVRVRLQMLETEPYHNRLSTSIADGDSLRYYPVFDVPARAELPAQPPLVAELRIQLLLQQRLDGCLTVGDTHELDEPFSHALAEAPYGHLRERVESLLGEPMPPVRRRWAGVYCQTARGSLYHRERVGASSWVVTGAGGRGMTLAPAIAEEMLDLVAGYEPGVATASSSVR